MLPLDSNNIKDLADKYGSPLFIASAEKIRNNIANFKSAFLNKYPKIIVSYSYKVNNLPELLKVIHSQDIWAEVASGFEYQIARKLEIPGPSLVFNGPYKSKEELAQAVNEGALINVDHLDEIEQLEEIASEIGKIIDIGIRLNMEVGIDQLPDRFGFNIENGEALEVVTRCHEKGFLNIIGLHGHLTSYIIERNSESNIPAKAINLIWPKDHRAYQMASEKIVSFTNEISTRYGLKIKYLDMGGGFPTVDGITPYVDAIVDPILSGFEEKDLPTLILEPGRAIVSDTVHLITTVVASKILSNGQRAVVVDAGINILPTSFWKFQDIECLNKSDANLEETIIYGPLCLQTDIISKIELPELKAGDKLLVKNIGAYNLPQSSTFIYAQPTVVLIDNDIRIIRKKQEIDDIF